MVGTHASYFVPRYVGTWSTLHRDTYVPTLVVTYLGSAAVECLLARAFAWAYGQEPPSGMRGNRRPGLPTRAGWLSLGLEARGGRRRCVTQCCSRYLRPDCQVERVKVSLSASRPEPTSCAGWGPINRPPVSIKASSPPVFAPNCEVSGRVSGDYCTFETPPEPSRWAQPLPEPTYVPTLVVMYGVLRTVEKNGGEQPSTAWRWTA